MKVMTSWTIKSGTLPEIVDRYLAGQAAPGEGVTLLGRWHNIDLSGGFSLFETSDPAALYRSAARWADVMDMKSVLVVEDDVAAPAVIGIYKRTAH